MMKRWKFWIALLVLAGGVAILRSSMSDQTYVVRGTTWRVSDADWLEHDKEWRLRATLEIASSKVADIRLNPEVFRDICTSIVTNLPHSPDTLSGPDQMYRVDLHLPVPDGQTERALVPVRVRDGTCRPAQIEEEILWTFQSSLRGYVFKSYAPASSWKIPSMEKKVKLVLNWSTDANELSLGEFDYLAACRSVLADPPPALSTAIDLTKVSDIEVRLNNSIGGGIFSASVYSSVEFELINGTCMQDGGVAG